MQPSSIRSGHLQRSSPEDVVCPLPCTPDGANSVVHTMGYEMNTPIACFPRQVSTASPMRWHRCRSVDNHCFWIAWGALRRVVWNFLRRRKYGPLRGRVCGACRGSIPNKGTCQGQRMRVCGGSSHETGGVLACGGLKARLCDDSSVCFCRNLHSGMCQGLKRVVCDGCRGGVCSSCDDRACRNLRVGCGSMNNGESWSCSSWSVCTGLRGGAG